MSSKVLVRSTLDGLLQGHLLTADRFFLGWGICQHELQLEGAKTIAYLPKKPGGDCRLRKAA